MTHMNRKLHVFRCRFLHLKLAAGTVVINVVHISQPMLNANRTNINRSFERLNYGLVIDGNSVFFSYYQLGSKQTTFNLSAADCPLSLGCFVPYGGYASWIDTTQGLLPDAGVLTRRTDMRLVPAARGRSFLVS